MASSSRVTMTTQKSPADARIQPLLFSPLTPEDLNLVYDAQVVRAAEDLDKWLEPMHYEGRPPPPMWHTLLIFRRHLDPALRHCYIQINDPSELWTQLNARFNNEQNSIIPHVRNKWINLRVLDFSDLIYSIRNSSELLLNSDIMGKNCQRLNSLTKLYLPSHQS